MIFTLQNVKNDIHIPPLKSTDIFCFFHRDNAISTPKESFIPAISASLRLKKNVLVLEENALDIGEIVPTKRWCIGSNSIWLSPRALSAISEGYGPNFTDYNSLKSFLLTNLTHQKKTNY